MILRFIIKQNKAQSYDFSARYILKPNAENPSFIFAFSQIAITLPCILHTKQDVFLLHYYF